jgi:hypothetical protein
MTVANDKPKISFSKFESSTTNCHLDAVGSDDERNCCVAVDGTGVEAAEATTDGWTTGGVAERMTGGVAAAGMELALLPKAQRRIKVPATNGAVMDFLASKRYVDQ